MTITITIIIVVIIIIIIIIIITEDALLSTWLHEANDSLEQSLRDAGVPAFQERQLGEILEPGSGRFFSGRFRRT